MGERPEEMASLKKNTKRKFNNRKIEWTSGEKFDSAKEERRYIHLQELQKQGIIKDLRQQVPFELIPKQRLPHPYKVGNRTKWTIDGVDYIADIVYRDADDNLVVEDVKPTDKNGEVTKFYKGTSAWAVYMIKKKLMLQKYGIQIKEV